MSGNVKATASNKSSSRVMHVSLKVSKFLYRPILERLCHKFQVMSTTSTNRYQSKSTVEFYLTFAFNGISFLWVWRMEESSVRSILESSLLSSSLSFNASRDNITLSEIAQRPSQLNLEKLAHKLHANPCLFGPKTEIIGTPKWEIGK